MALSYAHGAIQWLAADAATTTYVVSGLGFQPKAIRFTCNGIKNTADAASEALSIRASVGFCVSTSSRRCVGSFSADAAATTDCSTGAFDDGVIVILDGAAAVDGELDVSAIGSDGFTAIVDNQVSVDITVFWEAWGGSDITVAAVGDIAEPAATGDQDYTVTGFVAGATDQVVMLAGVQSTAAVNTGFAEASSLYIGYATGSGGENIVIMGSQDDASAAADTDCYGRGDECLAMIIAAGAASTNARASLTQFGTDNFRLNWAQRTTSNRRSVFLAIKGGSWRVGDYTIDDQVVGNTTTVSGLPFAPIGISLIGLSRAESTSGTTTVDNRLSWGCGSSTSSRRSMSMYDENAADPTQCNLLVDYDSVLSFVGTTGALARAFDINAMNSDGFQIIVDTAGTLSNGWQGYLAFGDAPAAATVLNPRRTLMGVGH